MWNYLYLCVCLLFSLLLLFFLKSKKRINSKENELFNISIYLCVFSVATELVLQYITLNIGTHNLITDFFNKLYLLSIIVWFVVFSKYIFYIFKPDKSIDNYENYNTLFLKRYKIINDIHNYLCVLLSLIICVLPIEYFVEGTKMYSYGLAVYFLKIVLGLFMFSWILLSIKNYKRILNIKYLPILIVFILLISNIVLQHFEPTMLIVSFTLTFLSYILYHTIENPDVKLISELNIAKEQAEKANNAKSDFLSSMSHEIRTPLNAIVGFSQDLSEKIKDNEQKEEVQDIIMAADSLLEIVNGILDISKIEANKLEIINTEYNFKKIFDELVVLSKARLGEKPLDFRVKYDESIPSYLYGDYTRLKQIILNLLTNAIKYTKEGYIDFTINSIKKDNICRLIISVEDSGIGIKNENIDKLFTKFERFDKEKNITIEGTGLGLAITKKLVELMNGNIVVQSVYGKGSKFTVAIDQVIVDKVIDEEIVKEQIGVNDFSKYKVLVVDDNLINLKVATKLLESFKLNIETCESGLSCLDKINNGEKYDLILMDDMMPKLSGVETFKKLKEKEGFNTPVIALTANAISGMKEKYLDLGFDDYLAKPIDKQELIKVLNKFFLK